MGGSKSVERWNVKKHQDLLVEMLRMNGRRVWVDKPATEDEKDDEDDEDEDEEVLLPHIVVPEEVCGWLAGWLTGWLAGWLAGSGG